MPVSRMWMRLVVVLWGMLTMTGAAAAQSDSAFTYQGRMQNNGLPLTGVADFRFFLYDSAVGGSAVQLPNLLSGVAINRGVFVVKLDFGADAFDGSPRWLEIQARSPAGVGSYTTLSPRQSVTSAPYAIQTRGIFVGDNDRIGIGTTAPTSQMQVRGDGSLSLLRLTNGGTSGTQNNTGLIIADVVGAGRAASFFGNTSDALFTVDNDGAGPAATFNGDVSFSDGRVGIGTTSPIAQMQVRGDGSLSLLRLTNGGTSGTQNNTALIIGDVTGSGRAASLFGITSSTLLTVDNIGVGRAASFSGDVSFTSGSVAIGTTEPKGLLRVEGDYYGLGHMWLHAYEGDGQSGTAYVQARDDSGTSDIDLVLRTQLGGNFVDAVRMRGSRVSINAGDTASSARLNIAHANSSVFPSTVLRLDRVAEDGDLITFTSLGSQRGNITVNGNTVSYNAFTGSHYAYPDGVRSIERGTLVRMTGHNTALTDEPDSEVVYGVTPTSFPNDHACLGAYLASQTMPDGAMIAPHLVMAAGNGDMWVVESGAGDIEPGDGLISSATTGCAMKDDPTKFAVGYVMARSAQHVHWARIAPGPDGLRRAKISVLFGAYERGTDTASLEAENRELRDRLDKIEALVGRLAPHR